MRAPMLDRKSVPAADEANVTSRSEINAWIELKIDAEGKVEQIGAMEQVPSTNRDEIARDIRSWRFSPATKNGVPIPVDVVLILNFRLPVTAGTR